MAYEPYEKTRLAVDEVSVTVCPNVALSFAVAPDGVSCLSLLAGEKTVCEH